MLDTHQLQTDLETITLELIDKASLSSQDIFVLGCSSSEVMGGVIGKNSSEEVGNIIITTLLSILNEKNIYLAVQRCEHINRALTVESHVAREYGLEEVAVVPALHAGGSCATAAYKHMTHPVVVEHITAKAGIDIGDTSIGMHIKHVQVPIRPSIKELGGAHVTALGTRPKLIGGTRAVYE